MMKQCAICGKGSTMGGKRNLLRGKYNPTRPTRKYPNLQWTRLPGKEGRVKVCTRCLKTLSKQAV
ncbi:MAG: 50S ribosomal protein L28 [Candidatus Niyogibacteria bacterium]|nr:50S ribosomal protein L28 [Candidatus Niyogibacteria bacterium]